MYLIPKNWHDFQHYNKRNPPWVKLHKKLLDDSTFQSLPDASRALAPMLWLLASEQKDGTFNGASAELAFRLRKSEKWVSDAIKPLINSGLFIVASNALADCKQHATPETETEAERETEIPSTKGKLTTEYSKEEFSYNPDEEVDL
jgi:hypothetical protein